MRAQEFITEYRESHLYHATTFPDALRIWSAGAFRKGTSFTRMWAYVQGYAMSLGHGELGRAIFAMDADRLRREFGRRNLRGYDWFQAHDPQDAGRYRRRDWNLDTDRAEERNLKPLPVKPYLARLDLWLPVDHRPKPGLNHTFRYNNPPLGLDPHRDEDWASFDLRREWMKNWVESDPRLNAAWQEMQQDPRIKIHPVGPMPRGVPGLKITARQQYDRDHPAYGSAD